MEQIDIKTQDFWSKGFLARLYRKFAGRHFMKMHKLVADIVLNNRAESLLDIACGPGDFLAYIKQKNPNIKIYGTDIAPGMLEFAKGKLGKKANIQEADSQNQPFPDQSLDAVTVMMAFHHFPNQLASLKEIKRILKTSGICLIADIVAKSDFQKSFWNFLEKLTGIRGHIGHYTIEDFHKLAIEAGFTDIRCESVPSMAGRYKVCQLKKI